MGSDETKMNWRIRHEGRDAIYYEELHEGTWRGFELGGEMLIGPAHHAICFGSLAEWNLNPEWTHGRRDEIVARVKSVCRPPDYEYEGEAILNEHDLQRLIEAAGGLSSDECRWAGCNERALQSKWFCVIHANRSAV